MPEQGELKLMLYKQLELQRGEDGSWYNHPTTPPTLASTGGCKVTSSLDLHELDAIPIPKVPRNGWPKISLHTSTSLDIRGHGSDYEMGGAGGDRQENNGQGYRHKVQRKVEKH